MTKVVHLTTVHQPRDVRIFYKEARSLARAGYEVVIIAPGQRDELADGVRIRVIPAPAGRLRRATVTQLSLLRAALSENASIYHFHDPELMLVGLALRTMGKRVVYDVHEDLPRQILHKTWIAPPLRTILSRVSEAVELVSARLLSAVVVATPSIGRRFPSSRTTLVQNFPLSEEIGHPGPMENTRSGQKAFYAGGLELVRGARTMVEAVGLLGEESQVRLVLAGEFSPPELQMELGHLPGWNRVQYLGWRKREELRQQLADATVGLVLFHPLPNHINAQPNKLFEYMGAGLPVIASDFPMWRSIVDTVGCGLLVDPCSPDAIAAAIQWVCDHPEEARKMGSRGCEAVRDLYNWNAEAKSLVGLYSRLC